MLTSDSTKKQIENAKRYVLDGTERCLELITNIRKTEESKSEPLVPVKLNNILSAEAQLFSSQHGVTPEMTDIPEDLMVYADGALGHLFWNIMEGKKKGKTFKVIISDDGPGLRGTRKDHLLDPGRRYGGVGLHLVRRLAEKYGAHLEVQDRVKGKYKQGLEIVISLRIAD
jgi:hypothetical protein